VELIGSMVLLWTAFNGVAPSLPTLDYVWGAAGGGIWFPFFVGAAVISSVVLLFLSFTNLTLPSTGYKARLTSFAAIVAGATLVPLTWGNSMYLAQVVVGFVLSYYTSGITLISDAAKEKRR